MSTPYNGDRKDQDRSKYEETPEMEEMEEVDVSPEEQVRLQRRLLHKITEVAQDMERFNLSEYITLLNSPRRFFFINLMAGIARGFGFALGATVLGALVLYLLQRMVVLNLPLIGDFIAELVRIVQQHL